MSAIPFVSVVKKGSKPGAPKVPAAYGKLLIDTGVAIGLTRPELAKLAGKDDLTAWRVETGKGSVIAANALRSVLLERGVDIEPVPVGVANWSPVKKRPQPRAMTDEHEVIRRNLVEARDRLGYDVHDVNSLTGIPLEQLRRYENGDEPVSGLHLKQLAKLYGYTMDEITEPAMPAPNPTARQVIHMRTDPGALEILSAEEREQLERLKKEAAALNAAARKRLEDARTPRRSR